MALSDESLLAGMAAGDAPASAAFVRRYQARVFGLARTIVGDAALAEEVAQEAFVRAWRHAGAYDPRRGAVPTWLLTITRNLAVDAVRFRREDPVDPVTLLTSLLDREALRGAAPADPPQADQAQDALRALPAEQATAIVLTVFYGLTAKDVARHQAIPLGTAKTRIRRGLATLRQRMGVSDG